MTRVAGILVNLVPYHHARWEAFAQCGIAECDLIELTDGDELKVLEFAAPARYRRHTLFPSTSREVITQAALRYKMVEALNAIRPDVLCISGWDWPVSLTALVWAWQNSVSAVILSESIESDAPRLGVKELIKRQLVTGCAAALVGGSPQAEYLVKLGMPPERTFLGYDAVDNHFFSGKAEAFKEQPVAWRIRFGLPERFFLASARFIEKKNLPRLLEAYARYRTRFAIKSKDQATGTTKPGSHPQPPELSTTPQLPGSTPTELARPPLGPWSLVLLGDGPLRSALSSLRSSLGLSDSVLLPGARPYSELPAYYGLARAFVHASTTEPWGLVVNEAMAAGLPVLVSNRCGCALDLVREGVNGLLFDPFNVEQLAERMLHLSTIDESTRHRMGAAGQRIIANWGPERFASGLEAAIEKALEVGPVRPTFAQRATLQLLLRRRLPPSPAH
jgi:1,2-diacylglycerol 3-alpha-glucosyltransferase